MFEKSGTENDEEPFNKILKTLDMGSISSRKHEMEIKEILETLKARNREAFKPSNFETKKPRNHHPWHFSFNYWFSFVNDSITRLIGALLVTYITLLILGIIWLVDGVTASGSLPTPQPLIS